MSTKRDASPGSGRSEGLTYRLAEPSDADAASRVLTAALRDLAVRQGRPPFAAPADHAAPVLRHVRETDGGRFWVAVADGRPVAFGAGWERGGERARLGYCGGLFVSPEWQGKGVGRRLFEHAMEGLPAAGGIAALTSNAANPISNGLYARHGIYQLHALLYLTGSLAAFAGGRRPHGAAAGGLDVEPLDAGHLDELRAIDEAVLGVDRTLEHRWFLSRAENPGWLLRRRGRAIGYAYLGGDGTEGVGALGPIATLRPQDQSACLRFALAELAARDVAQTTVTLAGPNIAAQRLLWSAGFAFTGATGLLCASRPFGRFDRYLLAGDCLL